MLYLPSWVTLKVLLLLYLLSILGFRYVRNMMGTSHYVVAIGITEVHVRNTKNVPRFSGVQY